MISVGIDVGSVAAKAVAFDGTGIIATALIPTGWSPKKAGEQLLMDVIKKGSIEKKDIKIIVGTGYGRISLPFLDKKVTEITCHGKGAYYIDPLIRTIIDIGGQDSKVIKLNEKGNIIDFMMNDKCAAGTGRFLQVMANTLGVEVQRLSILAQQGKPVSINSMCTVFAESEIVSLMAEGASKEAIAAGLLQSVANKTYSLVGKLGIEGKVFFSGGVSQNLWIRKLLSDKLGVEIITSENAQIMGALGAALIGYETL